MINNTYDGKNWAASLRAEPTLHCSTSQPVALLKKDMYHSGVMQASGLDQVAASTMPATF